MTYATITTTQEILETSQQKYQQQPLNVTAISEKVSKAKQAN